LGEAPKVKPPPVARDAFSFGYPSHHVAMIEGHADALELTCKVAIRRDNDSASETGWINELE
jgi:hypothetical protein